MPHLRSAGADLFYTDHGSGPDILLVHGWACDSHDWSWQIGRLAEHARVIAPDLRGHGRSSDPGDDYHPSTFAADLVALLDHLAVDRAVVVGHSMGALISSVLAAEAPERVRGLVLVDPPYGFDAGAAAANLEFARQIDDDNAVALAADRLRSAEGPATPDHLVTWHQRRVHGTSPRVLAGAVHAVHGSLGSVANSPQTQELIAHRRSPVLAFYTDAGRADWERSQTTDPRSRVIAYEGAGHWLHQERHDDFGADLEEWMGTLP